MRERWYECDCCGREVCYEKKPGIGYVCDPCVKCYSGDQGRGDEPWPVPGEPCYYPLVYSTAWMQAQASHSRYLEGRLREALSPPVVVASGKVSL